jgi:hypothetical protein
MIEFPLIGSDYSVRSARLDRDLDAVTNGLTLTWSSGTCEGAVNRVKAWEEIDVRPSQTRFASAPHPAAELTPNLTLRCHSPKSGPDPNEVAGLKAARCPAGSPGAAAHCTVG